MNTSVLNGAIHYTGRNYPANNPYTIIILPEEENPVGFMGVALNDSNSKGRYLRDDLESSLGNLVTLLTRNGSAPARTTGFMEILKNASEEELDKWMADFPVVSNSRLLNLFFAVNGSGRVLAYTIAAGVRNRVQPPAYRGFFLAGEHLISYLSDEWGKIEYTVPRGGISLTSYISRNLLEHLGRFNVQIQQGINLKPAEGIEKHF